MRRALAYLAWRTTRNRVARQWRRLRSPRYLVAVLLGAAYFWVLVGGRRPGHDARPPAGPWTDVLLLAFLVAATLWAWLLAGDRRALAFSPAEVDLLFPAPITRRGLIQYKLLRRQLPILVNALLWTVFIARQRLHAEAVLRVLGMWLLFTTLSLHRLGASFVRASLAEQGRSGLKRRAVSVALAGTFAVTLAFVGWDMWTAFSATSERGLDAALEAVRGALARPLPRALLLPFRWLARPALTTDPPAWLRALGPAAALLVAHYVWVIRSDAAFEEGAAETAYLRHRERGRAPRAVKVTRSAALAATGWKPGALVWKNLLAFRRGRRVGMVAVTACILAVGLAALSFHGNGATADAVGWILLTWAVLSVGMGPQWVRNDLRGDLPKLDLLRSYPLHGWEIVAAQAAASAFVLTLGELALVGLAWCSFLGNRAFEIGLGDRTAVLIGVVVLLPSINLMAMAIQNTAAVVFPEWVRHDGGRAGRIEALGQSVLVLALSTAILLVFLAAPAAIVLGAVYLLRDAVGWWAWVPAAPVSVGVLLWETRILMLRTGRIFERTEPLVTSPME